jgi:glutamate 5-kinase
MGFNMRDYRHIKRIIIKIGSSSLVSSDKSLNEDKIAELMEIVHAIKQQQKEVVLVTSGAIAVGMNKLGLKSRPKTIPLKQACAALGQVSLIETYEKYAQTYQMLCAQILVNHDDFENRHRMLNLSNTFEMLFANGVIPIVNENDALATEEIKVGDNDTLSALLVPMINADLLVLISDIDGLYNKNPREFTDAILIDYIANIDHSIDDMVGVKKSDLGTGGMATKIKAARIATNSGCNMLIINANKLHQILDCLEGKAGGTWFASRKEKMKSREHWIIYNTYAKGIIVVDQGAAEAIFKRKSLLPKGILEVKGRFLSDSVVFIEDEEGKLLAKGIANYSSEEINHIKGKPSSEILSLLGHKNKDEVIHANDLVIIKGEDHGKIK